MAMIAVCPDCGHYPMAQSTKVAQNRAAKLDPSKRVQQYSCSRCGKRTVKPVWREGE